MVPITLTPAAIEHIKHMLEKNAQAVGFRLSIKKTGCSGFAYVPDIIEQVQATDLHFTAEDLPVYIDPSVLEFIQTLEIDYVQEAGSGLMQKRLVFINPKEKGRCGCGESFTIE